jgi:hypothetical protein
VWWTVDLAVVVCGTVAERSELPRSYDNVLSPAGKETAFENRSANWQGLIAVIIL